jgi:Flp pilus assembly protein TadB
LKWLYRIVGGAPNDGIEWVLFPFVLILTSVTLALVIIAIGLIPILVLGVAWLMVWLFKRTRLGRGTAPAA